MEEENIFGDLGRRMQDQFSRRRGELQEYVNNKINSAEIPDFIYHYTDYAGLHGALKEQKLWVNDALSMNDPTELIHAVKTAVKILEEHELKNDPHIGMLRNEAEDFIKRGAVRQIGHIFACCFSKFPNDLGQWRAYADNGRGYCIVFDTKALETHFISKAAVKGTRFSLFVQYNDEDLKIIIDKIINSIIKFIVSEKGSIHAAIWDLFLDHVKDSFLRELVLVSIMFKNEAYISEGEYRFAEVRQTGVPLPELRLRLRPYVLTRYLEFDFSECAKAVRSIIVGPAAGDRGERFANDCKREFLGDDHPATVIPSGIPYQP